MDEKLTAIKSTVALFLSAASAFLGWKGVLILTWAGAMVLDYISGTCAAAKAGRWSSKIAREGLWHKMGMLLVVIVAVVADIALEAACRNLDMGFEWKDLLLPLVLVWYIITETGSILENAIELGARVPSWLVKLMKASLRAVDRLGEQSTGDGTAAVQNESEEESKA